MSKAHWFPIYRYEDSHRVLVLALQGLANRTGPRLLVDARFWNYPPADAFWKGYYEANKDCRFEPVDDIDSLLEIFSDCYHGVVIYDPRLKGSMCAALTLAAQQDLLPLSSSIACDFPQLPVKENLVGRFASDAEAVQWEMENLLPCCKRGLAYAVSRPWSGWSVDALDYAVMEKAFTFTLRLKDASPEEERLGHRLMRELGPDCAMMGWAEPEDDYVKLVSRHNSYILCAEASNLSFHSKIPARPLPYLQKARRGERAFEPANVHYVAFMTSEGDSPKIHAALQGGAWLDLARGAVPINWGNSPRVALLAPALAEYYYDTATGNDYFVCGASGSGYVLPNEMPEPQAFFERTGRELTLLDLTEVESWLRYSRPVYESYAALSRIKGFFMPGGPRPHTFAETGAVVTGRDSTLNYIKASLGREGMLDTIVKAAEARPKPSFDTVFFIPDAPEGNPAAEAGFSPSDLLWVAERLPDDFKVVTLEEMVFAMRAARCSGTW